ncbi:hypothetical protein CPB84DRAFT_1815636 [Gymnopilus junonius]|uniref:Uncharacterized protein n=1 Tax=Gymnopilus junonius TaxID=109634 RepID=A0A9P5NJW5_GYMJU|nr:hypothetical protein CPB84DRAFT_1815636 [Gymnopilus junonius]
MFADGSIAVALVKNQVMIVQAARTHTKREKYLDVRTYSHSAKVARISSSDLLTVLPSLEDNLVTQGMLELPKNAYSQYMKFNSRHQKRYESLWSAWVSKH